jgi:phosphate transport system substrate-binding protein
VKTWKDVRPEWPAEEIKLYGPGTDSGTFEYFTEEIVGEAKKSRPDYTASEDDNVLVQGIAGDKNSLGYFGYAYYEENADKLKLVPIDAGDGKAVAPNADTIKDGSYKPLSRPLFIYVNKKSLEKPEVKEFVKFYLENAPELVKSVFYVPMPEDKYKESLAKIQ